MIGSWLRRRQIRKGHKELRKLIRGLSHTKLTEDDKYGGDD